jgi:MFS family permease
VAPIALMTEEAFGGINPEQLVVVFLCANGLGTACEPIILSRLGLRRTVLFGALLLMIGSIIKSGGMPPIIQANLQKGEGEWRVYLGFFLVGLSQPLYQCTPALLSASWFPERERTLATGVALNSNQLGIGCAFIFGTLLVKTSDDIPGYFGLLSIISTLTFLGTLIQFDDAPPTPPSDTARVMRGTFEGRLPSLQTVFEYVGVGTPKRDVDLDRSRKRDAKADKSTGTKEGKTSKRSSGSSRRESSGRRPSRSSNRKSPRPSSSANTDESTASSNTRRRAARSQNSSPTTGLKGSFHGLAPAPSPARWGPVSEMEPATYPGMHAFPAPSPMMPGATGDGSEGRPSLEAEEQPPQHGAPYGQHPQQGAPYGQPPQHGATYGQPPQQGAPYGYQQPFPYEGYGYMTQQPGGQYAQPEMHYSMGPSQEQAGQPMPPGMAYGPGAGAPPYAFPYQAPAQYPYPYWDPQFQHMAYHQQQQQQQQEAGYYQPPIDPHYYSYQQAQPQPYPYPRPFQYPRAVLPFSEAIDEGAEPVLTMTPHHLEIAIRDDQIWLSTRACLARPGFIHALVSFTVSGIVINTLSTFMDYLVRLNGAGREYTGIVGGSFQVAIMVSSLIVGQFTDKTRAYYSVTVGMLVLGAFGLAECGVNLDEDRGDDLRWSLVIVAILVGPLQPVSTELGVDVVYPLSENTVLVIQQLFSNMLSALFIPCFKAMKDVGRVGADETTAERPAYTFSFYLLIILHAAATVFFATFNGRYLRYEHEQEKKAQEEQRKAEVAAAAFQPVRRGPGPGHAHYPGAPDGRLDMYRTEKQPLLHPID